MAMQLLNIASNPILPNIRDLDYYPQNYSNRLYSFFCPQISSLSLDPLTRFFRTTSPVASTSRSSALSVNAHPISNCNCCLGLRSTSGRGEQTTSDGRREGRRELSTEHFAILGPKKSSIEDSEQHNFSRWTDLSSKNCEMFDQDVSFTTTTAATEVTPEKEKTTLKVLFV